MLFSLQKELAIDTCYNMYEHWKPQTRTQCRIYYMLLFMNERIGKIIEAENNITVAL